MCTWTDGNEKKHRVSWMVIAEQRAQTFFNNAGEDHLRPWARRDPRNEE